MRIEIAVSLAAERRRLREKTSRPVRRLTIVSIVPVGLLAYQETFSCEAVRLYIHLVTLHLLKLIIQVLNFMKHGIVRQQAENAKGLVVSI